MVLFILGSAAIAIAIMKSSSDLQTFAMIAISLKQIYAIRQQNTFKLFIEFINSVFTKLNSKWMYFEKYPKTHQKGLQQQSSKKHSLNMCFPDFKFVNSIVHESVSFPLEITNYKLILQKIKQAFMIFGRAL